MMRYRSEYGCCLADGDFARAKKLEALANDHGAFDGERRNARALLQKLLAEKGQPAQRPAQPPLFGATPPPQTQWGGGGAAGQRRRTGFSKEHADMERQRWQAESDRLHQRPQPMFGHMGPRASQAQPSNDFWPVFLAVVALMLYVLFK